MRSTWYPTHELLEVAGNGAEKRTPLTLTRAATPGLFSLFTEQEWGADEALIPPLSIAGDGIVRRDGLELAGATLVQIGGEPLFAEVAEISVSYDRMLAITARAMLITLPPPATWNLRNGEAVDVKINTVAVGSLLLSGLQMIAASQDLDIEDLIFLVRANYDEARRGDATTFVQDAAALAVKIAIAESPEVVDGIVNGIMNPTPAES